MNNECFINNYRIEKLKPEHVLYDFNCGNNRLNNFLKYEALEQQLNRFNVTYLAIYEGVILGFYSILADNIQLKRVDFDIPKEYKNAPAIKIGQFAVDEKFRNTGFGTELLDQASLFIKMHSNRFGIKYITVDAYVSARGFYERNDFQYVSNVNLKKLEKAEKRNPTSIVVMYKNIDYI